MILTTKNDFPILKSTNRGKPLVYLDTAASAQKPKVVIDALQQFYQQDFANIHRGIYELSERASYLYEKARETVKNFIRAKSAAEIVFVRGTTEAINLVAQCYGKISFTAGDEVIIGEAEHHANIVPWYLLKEQLGIKLIVLPIEEDGTLNLETYKKLFSKRTKLVAISHASNVLGTINPIKRMIAIAHDHQVPVLVDGAQAVPHFDVDVKELDCDFYVFSAHKMYGPTGVGILYGKEKLLKNMPPYQGGGSMIESVDFTNITYAESPRRFEAGTLDIAGAIGFGAAIEYLQSHSLQKIFLHEQHLLNYAENLLKTIPDLKILGHASHKVGVISFVFDHIHAHDVGTILDHEGIAVRAGHHCAMPLMKRFNVPAVVRASFGIYTEEADIDALYRGLLLVKQVFQ